MTDPYGLRPHVTETTEQAATREQRNARRRAKHKSTKGVEDRIQKKCVAWARGQGIMLLHVPNQLASKSAAHGAILKDMGVTAGVADLLILSRCRDPMVRGLAIEMKAPGAAVPPHQRHWAHDATEQGWSCHVVRSLADFQRVCKETLLYPPTAKRYLDHAR